LYETGVSPNRGEKLAVKFDFETRWRQQKQETVLLNRYGFLANAVTKPPDQFLIEKLAAYLGQKETQPRHLYDLTWLLSRGAKPDAAFARANGYNTRELIAAAQKRFSKERLSVLKAKLLPFLVSADSAEKIAFFRQLMLKC
jgi:hypothetical protein